MNEATVDVENVESAVELIECATALGMQVRSPAGVTVYTAHYYLDQETTRLVGVFHDEMAAKTAVMEKIIQWWSHCEFAPWLNSYLEHGEMGVAEWEKNMRSFLEEQKMEEVLSFMKSSKSRSGTDWTIVESTVR